MKTPHRSSRWFKIGLPLLTLLLPSLAQAHPGLPGHAHGFNDGLAHPLTGLDHLCAMVAVGIWAWQCGGRMRWQLPLAFVSVMAIGGALGLNGIRVPLAEQGIAASLIVLGIFIAAAVRLPMLASAIVVGFFALFHGYAHGAEMPGSVSSVAYATGFLMATAILHCAGLALGLTAKRFHSARLIRYAGFGIAVCGIIFLRDLI